MGAAGSTPITSGMRSTWVVTASGSSRGVPSAAITSAGESLVLDVPWLQLAAVLAGAVVAGLLASVLPARRAARTGSGPGGSGNRIGTGRTRCGASRVASRSRSRSASRTSGNSSCSR